MLEQCCNHSKQCRNNVATLCRAKNRRCKSSRVTLLQDSLTWIHVTIWSRISSLLALRKVDKISMALIELGKSLLVEFEILGSGIQNKAQGFWNAANDWNREYKFHWQRMRNLSPWNPESKLSRIPLPDTRPIGQRDPKRKGRLRLNETRNKAYHRGQ